MLLAAIRGSRHPDAAKLDLIGFKKPGAVNTLNGALSGTLCITFQPHKYSSFISQF